jgi:TPR repeat protein
MEMKQLLKHVSLVCVCLFALTGQAMADSLLDAQRAYGAGDYAKAAKLFKPLAKQGNALAQTSLGVMYNNGQGVPQDDQEAEKWYRLAAEQGNAVAQSYLGWMYSNGQGVPQDNILAYMWLNIASATENDSARQKQAAENRDKTARLMTAQQIVEAQELAKKCTANKFKGC